MLQVAGEKHWTIHEPVHPDPLRGQPWTDHRDAVAERAAGPAAIDETLRPGDVLNLDAPAAGGVTIFADQTPVLIGKPGRSGSRRAVQITGNHGGGS